MVTWPKPRLSASGRPVFDDAGEFKGYRGATSDITERKQLEEQLRGAHKMEALGQVAGGLAHEFNNMLQAMALNLELLEDDLDGVEDPRERIRLMLEIVVKGRDIVDRLQSYVGGQFLTPEVIDVAGFVSDTAKLLRPLLGEAVEVETVVVDDPWSIDVDPAQLETALLDLAVNARDAMPKGGKVTVEVANVHLDGALTSKWPFEVDPGDYVMVAFSDTGAGMPDNIVERVFDPFFTTKEVGQGTGLGLSMVYGFAKQSDGYIKIDSEVGQGTKVALYLPREGESHGARV